MKIEKSLLAAMLLGVSAVGLSSCDKVEIQKEIHECTVTDDGETCTVTHEEHDGGEWQGDPCPTCGMG